MINNFLMGIAGLFALLGLIAIRVPIAYTMILIGFAGICLQSVPAIILNQLKDLAYAQFSNYDLSVLPMFILMGGLAARYGLSANIFRGANALAGPVSGRRRHRRHRRLRGLRGGLRIIDCHGTDHGPGRHPRTAQIPL